MTSPRTALTASFPYTLPILAGSLFLGRSYGICMHASGFPFRYPMLMSAVAPPRMWTGAVFGLLMVNVDLFYGSHALAVVAALHVWKRSGICCCPSQTEWCAI